MSFTENWYSEQQLVELQRAVRRVRALSGEIIELGCWEGKSTCALAVAAEPEPVIAVDNWTGSHSEGEGHPTVQIAKQRDVLAVFRENVAMYTRGNVVIVRLDHDAFIGSLGFPSLEFPVANAVVKFVHIDGAHDYASVRRQILGLKPHMVPGGIICGDDFLTASAQRHDLGGGVERAVRECCPNFELHGNLWLWVR